VSNRKFGSVQIDKYNRLLNHVNDNVNTFLIRLIELNSHVLSQAYLITIKKERKNIYAVHVDNNLIELVAVCIN